MTPDAKARRDSPSLQRMRACEHDSDRRCVVSGIPGRRCEQCNAFQPYGEKHWYGPHPVLGLPERLHPIHGKSNAPPA